VLAICHDPYTPANDFFLFTRAVHTVAELGRVAALVGTKVLRGTFSFDDGIMIPDAGRTGCRAIMSAVPL
jgi:hypothetical protein